MDLIIIIIIIIIDGSARCSCHSNSDSSSMVHIIFIIDTDTSARHNFSMGPLIIIRNGLVRHCCTVVVDMKVILL